MTRLYLTPREYDRLLEQQNGMCCVPWCENSEVCNDNFHDRPTTSGVTGAPVTLRA